MTHGHSVICRERQQIGKRALVIHLATNRYLSEHTESFFPYQQRLKRTFGAIRVTTTSKPIPVPPATHAAAWVEGVVSWRMQMLH